MRSTFTMEEAAQGRLSENKKCMHTSTSLASKIQIRFTIAELTAKQEASVPVFVSAFFLFKGVITLFLQRGKFTQSIRVRDQHMA